MAWFRKIVVFCAILIQVCCSQTDWDRTDLTDMPENLRKFANREFTPENLVQNYATILKLAQYFPEKFQSRLQAGQRSTAEKIKKFLETITDGPLTPACIGDILFFFRSAFAYADSLEKLSNLNGECPPNSQTQQPNCSCAQKFSSKMERCSWTLQVMDSFGKLPSGILEGNLFFLGSYEQCVSISVPRNKYQEQIKWEGKYCRADMSTYASSPATETPQCSSRPISTPESLIGATKPECSQMYKIKYGLCAPETCTTKDVTAILSLLLTPLKATALCQLNVTCHEKDLKLREDPKAILMIVFSVFIVLLIGYGTLYDVIVFNKFSKDFPETVPLNIDGNKTEINVRLTKNEFFQFQPWFVKVLLAFSLYRNIPKIMDVSKRKGQIDCLHGIRVLSMTWVMLGHCYYWSIDYLDNLKDAFDLPKHFLNQILLNASMCVDSFYVLSAMLLVYLFFKKMTKEKGKYVTSLPFWGSYILHRYIRLTPVYMVILALDVCLLRYTNDGPLWNQNGIEPNYCRNSWWTNLLYVNNFFQLDELCMSWSWYLANDMQFYLIAPFFLILLWKYEILGILALVGATLLSGIIKAVIILQHNNWPPVSIFTTRPDQFAITDVYWNTLYVKPYIRCKPYFIGMLLGYILFKYGMNAKIPKWAVIVGWLSSFAMGFGVIFGLYEFSSSGYISKAGNAMYAIFGRTLWSVALSWVIWACTTGYGGPVNQLLSWKMWQPFSRFTYCAYLVHPMLILGFYSSRERPMHIGSHFQMITYHIGHVILGYAVSFVLTLLFELPTMGIEQIIFPASRPKEDKSKPDEQEKVRGFENPNLSRAASINGDVPIAHNEPTPPATVPSHYTTTGHIPVGRTPSRSTVDNQ